MSFTECIQRPVMSADLLIMEPTLKVGTVVMVDGRLTNVEFLLCNLKKPWKITTYGEDVTLMELESKRLTKSTSHFWNRVSGDG